MNPKKYHIIDCHCDTITKLKANESLSEDKCDVSIRKMEKYGSYTQLFAIFVCDTDSTPFKTTMHYIDKFYTELYKNKNTLVQVKTVQDIEQVIAEGKLGAMLTIENGNALEGEISNLRNFYRLGVRAMCLTWNGQNEIADGIGEARGAGLSDFGRQVVLEMNRIGMMVDVSHLSEKGFEDVIEISEKPIMASHSNSRAISSHKRNLTDEQLRRLAEKGGITGLNLYQPFLADSGVATLENCLAHIRHIISVGGEDCLVLGSDFDGFSIPPMTELTDAGEYGNLFDLLKAHGFSNDLIEKITYKNFIRFAKAVLQ